MIKLLLFDRGAKNPKSDRAAKGNAPAAHAPTEALSFEESLRLLHFSIASRQLIQQEEQLFGLESPAGSREQERNQLQKKYEALLESVWAAVQNSMTTTTKDLAALSLAVAAIQQEEEQDNRWRRVPSGRGAPPWRPLKCRDAHDQILTRVVDARITQLEGVAGVGSFSSLVKTNICKMGKLVLEDLLKVVRVVKNCYPRDFDVCNLYARFYHQAFSKQLAKITESPLEADDCTYVLLWVRDNFPNVVLKHKEVEAEVDGNALGPLLPDAVVEKLEEQYLSQKEGILWTWVSTILKKEKESWQAGDLPELTDNYYSSPIAIDVIQCIDGIMKEAVSIMGERSKAQRIGCQLERFLVSYKSLLEQQTRGKNANTQAVIKANLACIEQFKYYIGSQGGLYTAEMRKHCLTLMDEMEASCYKYFLSIIHEGLKARYRMLGTPAWLKEANLMETMLTELEALIETHRDMKPTCQEVLLGQLHREVLLEYVRRLLKRKLKLHNRDEQEKLARLLCEDGQKLHRFFTWAGSKEVWLRPVLHRISEVLKLQDPGCIELEVVILAQDYPDLSDQHVSALLHLKANLSTVEIKRIRDSLLQNKGIRKASRAYPFFSRIHVKWIDKFI